jgi:hypothetical protein
MTRASVGWAINSLKAEVLESVASYFAPVRAVVKEVSESVSAGKREIGGPRRDASPPLAKHDARYGG